MGIPLVTSIWRGLAGMDDSLSQVWKLAKPLYANGAPEHALPQLIEQTTLPHPEPLAPTQLAKKAVDPRTRAGLLGSGCPRGVPHEPGAQLAKTQMG